ncbi:alpha/beta hydrolase [Brachybacterium hainanense]|uniref:Alpha/beta hydrolase n=1 Tax=Brachybacterium hainanense TaxID=1541174 RepID=A0ABV6R9J8_9MICO
MSRPRTARRWILRVLLALASLVAVLALVAGIGFVTWAKLGVMGAETEPWEAVRGDPGILVEEDATTLVLRPGDATASTPEGTGIPAESTLGLVFFPGAKVDAEAYAARLSHLVTEQDVTVVIVKPLLHLALLDPRGLDAFTGTSPAVTSWMVGGHSMGGVRACALAPDASALLLFASYCADDISASDVPVLSLAGSEDELSTPAKIQGARHLLPADAQMVEIAGASHASFGDYGPQEGDGTPTIDDGTMDAEVTGRIAELVAEAGLG